MLALVLRAQVAGAGAPPVTVTTAGIPAGAVRGMTLPGRRPPRKQPGRAAGGGDDRGSGATQPGAPRSGDRPGPSPRSARRVWYAVAATAGRRSRGPGDAPGYGRGQVRASSWRIPERRSGSGTTCTAAYAAADAAHRGPAARRPETRRLSIGPSGVRWPVYLADVAGDVPGRAAPRADAPTRQGRGAAADGFGRLPPAQGRGPAASGVTGQAISMTLIATAVARGRRIRCRPRCRLRPAPSASMMHGPIRLLHRAGREAVSCRRRPQHWNAMARLAAYRRIAHRAPGRRPVRELLLQESAEHHRRAQAGRPTS